MLIACGEDINERFLSVHLFRYICIFVTHMRLLFANALGKIVARQCSAASREILATCVAICLRSDRKTAVVVRVRQGTEYLNEEAFSLELIILMRRGSL